MSTNLIIYKYSLRQIEHTFTIWRHIMLPFYWTGIGLTINVVKVKLMFSVKADTFPWPILREITGELADRLKSSLSALILRNDLEMNRAGLENTLKLTRTYSPLTFDGDPESGAVDEMKDETEDGMLTWAMMSGLVAMTSSRSSWVGALMVILDLVRSERLDPASESTRPLIMLSASTLWTCYVNKNLYYYHFYCY